MLIPLVIQASLITFHAKTFLRDRRSFSGHNGEKGKKTLEEEWRTEVKRNKFAKFCFLSLSFSLSLSLSLSLMALWWCTSQLLLDHSAVNYNLLSFTQINTFTPIYSHTHPHTHTYIYIYTQPHVLVYRKGT